MITPTSSTSLGPAPETSAPADSVATMPDTELVRRFNAGEVAVFDVIVARYRRKLHSLALRRLRNHADAEEIVQDTFVRAYRGLGQYRGDCSLSSWLYRIAINLSCNRHWYFFRRHRHNTVSIDGTTGSDPDLTLENLLASDAPSPASEASVDELSELVHACTQRLGQQHRTILTLRNELLQSYQSIAATLGISVGTVKSRVARARSRLRQVIQDTYGDIGLNGVAIREST